MRRRQRLSRTTRILGAVVGGGFVILGIVELVTRLDAPLPLLFWLPTLWGGGTLVLIGMFGADDRPAQSVALVVVGTIVGLLASAWTILMPLLGITLIFLTILTAGRPRFVPADSGEA
jgi:hypothetical protein